MILKYVFFISAALYLIPLFIPTWKWYWVSSAVIGLPLSALWALQFYLVSQPDHQGSPGGSLGLFIAGVPTLAFLAGMFSRYCKWVVQLKTGELKAKKSDQKVT